MRLVAVCTLFAASLAAAGVGGKWKGTITTEMARETSGGSIPAYIVLEQANDKITGTAGPNEKTQFTIQKGSLEGDRLIIEASPKEGVVLRFVLIVKSGDAMEGDVAENGTIIGTTKLTRLR